MLDLDEPDVSTLDWADFGISFAEELACDVKECDYAAEWIMTFNCHLCGRVENKFCSPCKERAIQLIKSNSVMHIKCDTLISSSTIKFIAI